jgi:ATP-dependent exoDNAse (exonuclease V) beta subunit
LHEPPYLAVRTKQETDALTPDYGARGFVQERRPDLIVQDTHGQWHIIDFKTDHIDEMDIEKHNRQHAEQISEYVPDLQSLVKTPVTGWVYYAHHGQLAQIAVVITASPVEMLSSVQPRL